MWTYDPMNAHYTPNADPAIETLVLEVICQFVASADRNVDATRPGPHLNWFVDEIDPSPTLCHKNLNHSKWVEISISK